MDKAVGKRFKQYREQKGLTQEELGVKVGLSSNYISYIERGIKFPRYENFISILNVLEVTADDILCDVIECPVERKASLLSEQIAKLPKEDRDRILETVEFMIEQAERK